METNEIMTNENMENTIETTEEIVKSSSGNGVKVVAGIGIAVLVGGLAYKFVVKPTIAKMKARKEEERMEEDVVLDADYEEVNDEEESEEENE